MDGEGILGTLSLGSLMLSKAGQNEVLLVVSTRTLRVWCVVAFVADPPLPCSARDSLMQYWTSREAAPAAHSETFYARPQTRRRPRRHGAAHTIGL